MHYIVNDERVNINIGFIIPFLVLPQLVMSISGMSYGPSVCSSMYILTFVYLCRYRTFLSILKNPSLVLWLFLLMYHYFSAYIRGNINVRPIDYYHAMKMYCSVCVYTYFLCVDTKTTLKRLIHCLYIWLLLALVATGYDGGRLSGEKVIAVQFGKMSAILTICVVFYSILSNKKNIKIILYCLFPIFIILISQTRNAFGMVAMILTAYYFFFRLKGRINPLTLIMIVIGCLIIFYGLDSFLAETKIGQRFSETDSYNYYYDKGYTTGTFFDKIAGERLIYYVLGFESFLQEPIWGIGLNMYKTYVGGMYPMHVEYMVHLCEGGLVGASLYMTFLCSMAFLLKKTQLNDSMKKMLFSVFVIQLFTCMYSVCFNEEISCFPYALIISSSINLLTNSCSIRNYKVNRY